YRRYARTCARSPPDRSAPDSARRSRTCERNRGSRTDAARPAVGLDVAPWRARGVARIACPSAALTHTADPVSLTQTGLPLGGFARGARTAASQAVGTARSPSSSARVSEPGSRGVSTDLSVGITGATGFMGSQLVAHL